MLISFIVPVYNGEKTIEKCISSICEIKKKDIEIIVVNDGSTDTTQNKVEHMLLSDGRISVLNVSNGGVSNARNQGIKNAHGKYITFVDCDDQIIPENYDNLISTVGLKDYDFITCDFNYISQKDKSWFKRTILKAGENECNSLYEEMTLGRLNNVWCNLYKLEIVKKNKLQFYNNMKMGEDACFNMDYIDLCKSCYYYNKPVYEYSLNTESSAMNSYKASYLLDHILLYDRQLEFLCSHNINHGFSIDNYTISRVLGILLHAQPITLEMIRKFENSQLYDDIKNVKEISLKTKIKKIALEIIVFLYKVKLRK